MTPTTALRVVRHTQPGCSRYWQAGPWRVRLHHAETGGWELSQVQHPDGEQRAQAGLGDCEAARLLLDLHGRWGLWRVDPEPVGST